MLVVILLDMAFSQVAHGGNASMEVQGKNVVIRGDMDCWLCLFPMQRSENAAAAAAAAVFDFCRLLHPAYGLCW
jgi:hypothetical protein